MFIAKCRKRIGRTTQIKRAAGIEVGHEDFFVRAQNLGGFAHETNTRDDKGFGRIVPSETRHFQRVCDTSAGFFCQILNIAIDVVMRHEYRIFFLEEPFDFFAASLFFLRRQGTRHARPGIGDCPCPALHFGQVVLDFPDSGILHGIHW